MSAGKAKIQISQVEDATVARLLDAQITDQLYIHELGEELTALLEKADPPDLVIDFSAVQFLSSAVLGLLTVLLKRVRSAKGRLRLCAIRPSIYEAFQITNLDKVFEIYPDTEEALES